MPPAWLLLSACELHASVGAECLLVTEVVTSPTDWLFDGTLCEFEEVPGDTGADSRIDWVEICNPSNFVIRAKAYRLFTHPGDNPYAPEALHLPDVDLYAEDCLVMVAEPDLVGICPEAARFDLDQEIGANLLLDAGEDICEDPVRFERLELGWSRARIGIGSDWYDEPHPVPGTAVRP